MDINLITNTHTGTTGKERTGVRAFAPSTSTARVEATRGPRRGHRARQDPFHFTP